MEWPHPREHYRIMYPTAARPLLVSGVLEREVIDLSEAGIRFRSLDNEVWDIGNEVAGTIRFRHRDQQEPRVSGHVVRIDGRDVSVHLRAGVPLKIIIDEQRYLREHHRGLAW